MELQPKLLSGFDNNFVLFESLKTVFVNSLCSGTLY